MMKLTVASNLKKTESFPNHTPARKPYVETLSESSASLSQFLRVLFAGFLSRLLYGFHGEELS